MRSFLFALLLLLIPAAHAGSWTFLYSETSAHGESLDAFVKRIAPKAARTTDIRHAEVCGLIVTNGEGLYTIDIGTNMQVATCNMPEAAVYMASFHTHTRHLARTFSKEDYAHPGYLVAGSRVLYQRGVGTIRPL